MKEETKSTQVTFRVTPQEYIKLKAAAEQRGQSISQYASERVFREEGSLTVTECRAVHFSLTKIRDAIQLEDRHVGREIVQKECDEIWHTLKW